MRGRSVGAWAVVAVAVVASCSTNGRESSSNRVEPTFSEGTLTTSSEARATLDSLRERFRIKPIAAPPFQPIPAPVVVPVPTPVIGGGVATSFEATPDAHVHATIPLDAKHMVRRAASVDLPLHARGMVRLLDDTTQVSVGFALRDAVDSPIAIADGIAVYAGAFGGADVVHRVHAEGTEDFVVFEEQPAHEEIAYDVDVSRVPGLRLVANTLEFLDRGGTPVLRVAPPYIVDANGLRHEATLAIDECAYDTNTRAPWGRPVTKPGAPSCGVRVSWTGETVVYPALVDPVWVATGSMATARALHTATLLVSGQVLVAGSGVAALASAELFNPAGAGTFAATGSMAVARYDHTATLLASGKVLIAGGSNAGGPFATAELFDPGSGTFGPTGAMPSAHSDHSATLLTSGKVLIAGGIDATFSDTAVATLFDPTGAGTFAPTGTMNKVRDSQTATLLQSGKVLIAGGNGGGPATAELFDGAAFTLTGSMTSVRAHHTATMLASGHVLIAGGAGASGLLATAEIFDGTSTFAATGSMTTVRSIAAAALDATGKVLIIGGETSNVNFLASADLFDGTASFGATASMATARTWHTATSLLTGQVLVTGGQNPSNVNFSSAEIFYDQPAGDTCTTNAQCSSNVCNESCCTGACSGVCTTCAGSGACVAVKNADDPNTCTGVNTCDATGTCKLKAGQASLNPTTCASTFASDGFCCDSACAGPCDVCAKSLGASADGTCTPAPVHQAGSPACASGSLCNGTSAACPVSCAANTDCATNFCADSVCCDTACGSACDVCAKSLGASADGTCTPTPAGNAATPACGDGALCDGTNVTCPPSCTSGAECASNFCVDGVCCDSACDGSCDVCAKSMGASADGTCTPVAAGTPGMPACAMGALCNGTSATCPTSCASNSDCATNFCADGFCCDTACDGSCDVCAKSMGASADGICTPTPAGKPAAPACADGVVLCDGKSVTCPSSCTSNADCATNFCADGVCCNTVCTGECEACDTPNHSGTCMPVTGAPHGKRPPCEAPGGAACGGTCDGTNAAACTYPSSNVCATSCTSGQETDSTCDGTGKCVLGMEHACDLNIVTCENATSCKKTCAATTDCAAGNVCNSGKCEPATSGVCSGNIITSPDGAMTDCSPFNCEGGGMCRSSCSSVDDCATPNVCNAAMQCVAPAAADSGDTGGCSIANTPNDSPSRAPTLILTLGLCIAVLRRRRSANA